MQTDGVVRVRNQFLLYGGHPGCSCASSVEMVGSAQHPLQKYLPTQLLLLRALEAVQHFPSAAAADALAGKQEEGVPLRV